MSRLAFLVLLVGCQSQPSIQPVSSAFVVTEIESVSIESRAATTPESSSGNALPTSEQSQPKDGAARDLDHKVKELEGQVSDLKKQLGLKSMQLTEASALNEDLQQRVKDKQDSIDKLTEKRIAELDAGEQLSGVNSIAARPRLEAIIFTGERVHGEGWCPNCTKLKNRWSDGNAWIHLTWSDDVAPSDDHYPAIRFRDAAGKLRFPADEHENYLPIDNLDWLYRTIEMHQQKPVQQFAPQQPPVQNHRPKMIRPAVALSVATPSTPALFSALQSTEATR